MVIPEKVAPVLTETTLGSTDSVPTDSRKRNPINLGLTRLWLAYKYVDAAAESGKNPPSEFSLIIVKGQAYAGRDGRTCLARPNSQARTGTGNNGFSLFS